MDEETGKRIDRVEDKISKRIDSINDELRDISTSITQVTTRLDSHEDVCEGRHETINKRLNSLHESVKILRSRQDKWLGGLAAMVFILPFIVKPVTSFFVSIAQKISGV